jgi:uncharacterized protein YoxC
MARHQYITELLERITQLEKHNKQLQHQITTQEQTINLFSKQIHEAYDTTSHLLAHTQKLVDTIIQHKPPITIGELQQLDFAIQDTETLPLYDWPYRI